MVVEVNDRRANRVPSIVGRRLFVGFSLLMVGHAAAQGQPTSNSPADRRTAMLGQFGNLVSQMDRLGDWDAVQSEITASLENIFENRGWTTETDTFFRKLLIEPGKHPPGEIRQRLETTGRLLQERYHLSDVDRLAMERDIFREMLIFFATNAENVTAQIADLVQASERNKPVDKQVVAQLAKRSIQVRQSGRTRLDAMMGSLRLKVPEAYREKFEQDYKHIFEKRLPEIYAMEDRWARGQWTPADWGLENHPLYASPHEATTAKWTVPGVRPTDSSTWSKYVKFFIHKYDLDEAQQVTAWAVLSDLEPKAIRLASARPAAPDEGTRTKEKTVKPNSKNPAAQQADSSTDPVEQIFVQFVRRLDAIPTQSQRQRADSIGPVSPDRRQRQQTEPPGVKTGKKVVPQRRGPDKGG